jgi:Raf kinase inhibitor-like YbhB/YbcL family protein
MKFHSKMNTPKNISIIILISITLLITTMLFNRNNNYENINNLAQAKRYKNMKLMSNAFENNQLMPSKYTCDGENISPPLKITEIPENTKSLALICDDPDATIGTFVHWVMYNIPPTTKEIKENLPRTKILPDGSRQGITDFGSVSFGYGGPCPPSGTHRYFFKLYALDKVLNFESAATKLQLEKEMQGHIIEETYLIGLYKRK